MPQTRRVVKNSSYLVIAQVPIQAANALYVLILAQRLGVSDFGRFATLWALLAFFQTVLDQGIGRSITRDLASRAVSFTAGVVNGLVLAVALGVVSVGAMTTIAWALAIVVGHAPDLVTLAWVTGASLVPRAVWLTASAVFNAQQRMKISALLSVTASLCNVAMGLTALIAGLGLPGVLVASTVAQLVPMTIALTLLRHMRSGGGAISRGVLVSMGHSATPFVVRALLGIVYFRADLLLLTALAGFEAAGIYQAAYKVLELALVLPGAANSAAYPVISAYLINNRARAMRAYQRLLGGMFAVGLPLSALLFVGGAPLINLLYGRAYNAAAPLLAILAGAVLLSYVNAAPITLLSASPRQTALTVVTACGLIVNLAANALLIPRFAGQGAALAMIASEAVQCLLLFALASWAQRSDSMARTPEALMILGIALSAVLAYAPQAVLGFALGPAWLLAIPGLVVYLIGVALYARTLVEERAFDENSGVWEAVIPQAEGSATATTSNLPLIYVLVLNWNGWTETLACLASLRDLTYPNARIVVIDNGSTDDSLARLSETVASWTSSPCEVLALNSNAGFAGGMNRGIAHALAAGADYVFLLNNDTLVAPDVLEQLLTAKQAFPNAGLIGCELRYEGSEAAPGYALTGFDWLRGYARTWDVPPGGHGPVEVDVVSGCAVLASRELIDHIGLMDDRYFLYFEDVDWAVRTRRAGFTCLVARGALVWHRTARSTRGDQHAPRWTAYYYHTRNNMLLMRKLAPRRAQVIFVPFYLARTCGTALRVLGGGLLGRKRNVAPRLVALGAGFLDGWRGRWGPRTGNRAVQL